VLLKNCVQIKSPEPDDEKTKALHRAHAQAIASAAGKVLGAPRRKQSPRLSQFFRTLIFRLRKRISYWS
jgi:hypothetical protein